MKIVTYKCEHCNGEVSESDLLEIRTDNDEDIVVMNNIIPEGKDLYFKEAHFCSKECFVDFFFKTPAHREETIEDIFEIKESLDAKTFSEPAKIEVNASWDDVGIKSEGGVKTEEKEPQPEKPARIRKGWPKGKPRGPKVAENFRKAKNEKQEPKPEPEPETPKEIKRSIMKPVPLKTSKSTKQNDTFFAKLNFAKSLGYDSVSAALGEIDKYEFEKRFNKSEFAD